MKDVFKLLAKSISILLGLTAAGSATDAAIHKKMFWSGTTTLTISNEEMNGIIKIVKSLEKSSLLIKGTSGTTGNKNGSSSYDAIHFNSLTYNIFHY